jgi:hypothetical protein
MTAQEPDHKGHSEARTPAAQDFSADLGQLLDLLAPQAPIPGLLEEKPDAIGTLGRAAEHLNAQRRARGRPAGSSNRRNDETFDYLERLGFKMPERMLAEIISADPIQLAATITAACTYGPPGPPPAQLVMAILAEQRKAAADLMPYKFAKKQELKVEHTGGQVHVMMAGPLTRPGDSPATAFDLTGGADAQTVEYQDVSLSPGPSVASEAVAPIAQDVEQTRETAI